MVRFVLRSHEPVARIRKHLPSLLAELPQAARSSSVNLLPEHKAVLEGEHEIVLTDATRCGCASTAIDLHLRPQSFFQTNTEVAAALYARRATGSTSSRPTSVWDLYCGRRRVRAAHRRRRARAVTGIETSAEAVASADAERRAMPACAACGSPPATPRRSRSGADAAPDLVIVNPPRRGIGAS